ncbi:MAG: hypothetical protein GX786_10770 [Clostridiales bacterium]|nr:hypothetical protein [Clostridiales bacterium]
MADGNTTLLGGIAFELKYLTAGLEAGIKKFEQTTQEINRNYDSNIAKGKEFEKNIEASHIAVAASAALMAYRVKQALNEAIQVYAEYEQALTGIQNIAASKGIGDQALTASMDKVVDGFFTLKDASETYTNFLIMGFSTDQIEKMITAMKESASVARKSGHTIGSALSTASQGFRQELSTLSDAAGITTNISKMYEAYAKSLGKTVSALSDAEKNQAIYNAILSESEPYAGSYANTLDGMSGSLNSVTQAKTDFNIAFGEANAETMKAFNEIISGTLGIVTELMSTFPGATSAVTTFLISFLAIQGVTKATQVLSQFSGVASGLTATLGAITPVLTIIAAVASAGIGIYTRIKKEQEEARRAQEEYIKGLETEIGARSESINTLDALAKRYEELAGKENKSYREKRELKTISEELYGQYGDDIERLGGVKGAYDETTKAVIELVKAKREERYEIAKELYDANAKSLEEEKKAYDNAVSSAQDYAEAIKEVTETVKEKEETQKMFWQGGFKQEANQMDEDIFSLKNYLDELEAEHKVATETIEAFSKKENQLLIESLKLQSQALVIEGSSGAALFLENYISMLESVLAESEGAISLIDFSQIILGDITNVGNLNILSDYKNQILEGIEPSSEDVERYKGAWEGISEALTLAFGEENAGKILTDFAPWLDELPASSEEAAEAFKVAVQDMNDAAKATEIEEQFDKATTSAEGLRAKVEGLKTALPRIVDLKKAMDTYASSAKTAQDASNFNKVAKDLGFVGLEINVLGDNWKDVESIVSHFSDTAGADLETVQMDVLDLIYQFEAFGQYKDLEGNIYVDPSEAIAALNLTWEQIAALVAYANANGLSLKETGGGRSGGGGGGGRKRKAEEAQRAAEEAARAAEQRRKDSIQAEYDYISYLSNLNKIQLKEKIAMHEAIGRNHRLSVEEQRKLEVELYSLREELRQQQIDDDYAYIAHFRAIGEMTLAEEIKRTEAIRRNHALTAKEIWDLEETLYSLHEQKRQEGISEYRSFHSYLVGMDKMTKEEQIASLEKLKNTYQLTQQEIRDLEVEIYQLRKSLEEELAQAKEDARNKEISQLDSVTNAVIKALENRYKAMQDAELAELDKSKEAWKDWADSNIKGIQEQINALDKLKTSRDDEKAEADHLKKIAKLKEDLAFEGDSYNQEQIQKQIKKAEEAYQSWLQDKETRDQKEALQKEIEAIREEAKAKQEAIEAEKKALQELYQQQRDNAKQEAIDLITEADLDKIVDLIGSYNKDFNLAGTSLGEELYEGFINSIGTGIEDWMNSFMADMRLIQEEIHRTAQEATRSFYQRQQDMVNEAVKANTTNIQNTNQFFVPVNDYYQMQRKIDESNRALVKNLMGN